MTLTQVEKRIELLEKTVRRIAKSKLVDRKWYRTQAGRFAGDSDFDKIVKLGRAYRKSLSQDGHSKRT